MDLMEHSLVQSVCRRSEMEYNNQNRMVAEILAASSLNSNALRMKRRQQKRILDSGSGGEFEHLDNLNVQDELRQCQKQFHRWARRPILTKYCILENH